MDLKLTTLKEHSRKEIFFCVAQAPGSSRIFVGAADGNVYALDPRADAPEYFPLGGHSSFVTGIGVAGQRLVSASYDGKLLWRTLDGEVIQAVNDAHSRWIRRLAVSADGRLVATVADDMVCRVWDTASTRLLHELRGHEQQTPDHFPSMLYTCAFSQDAAQLATADKTGRICVWDTSTGGLVKQLAAPGFYTWDPRQRIHSIGGIRAVHFSPDGKTLLAGGIGTIGNIDHLDGPARIELFDLEKGESVHVITGDAKGLVEQLVFHPTGLLLGFGGDNAGFWQLYDLAEKKVVRSEKAPTHVHAAVLSDNASQLIAVGHGKILVWQVEVAVA